MSTNHFNTYTMNINKELIYTHPLFPLLTIVYNKCELATNSPYSLGSLNEDIIEFTKQLNQVQLQCYSFNVEVDDLMIQAIQILRFHLLEIEKVHELCDHFCERYINLLKSKMPLNTLTDDSKSDGEEEEDDDEKSRVSNEDFKPVCPLPTPTPYNPPVSISDETSENFDSDTYEENDDERTTSSRRQKKRGIFPKSATSLMRAWLFQHLSHPYPSEEEKKILAKETNLNILQVNNWFINARRRIVQPMVDQSNRAAMMGTDYTDFMSNHPYQTFDPNRTPYAFPTNPYNEIASTPAYCSSPSITYPPIPSNIFFPAVTAASTDPSHMLLSTQYGISSLAYHA